MYKIIKDGETIALTEQLNFIRQSEAGIFIKCPEKEAQGVAVKNTAYNLLGREPMDGCETVLAIEIDGGACLNETNENQIISDALIIDHEYRITLMEAGV